MLVNAKSESESKKKRDRSTRTTRDEDRQQYDGPGERHPSPDYPSAPSRGERLQDGRRDKEDSAKDKRINKDNEKLLEEITNIYSNCKNTLEDVKSKYEGFKQKTKKDKTPQDAERESRFTLILAKEEQINDLYKNATLVIGSTATGDSEYEKLKKKLDRNEEKQREKEEMRAEINRERGQRGQWGGTRPSTPKDPPAVKKTLINIKKELTRICSKINSDFRIINTADDKIEEVKIEEEKSEEKKEEESKEEEKKEREEVDKEVSKEEEDETSSEEETTDDEDPEDSDKIIALRKEIEEQKSSYEKINEMLKSLISVLEEKYLNKAQGDKPIKV